MADCLRYTDGTNSISKTVSNLSLQPMTETGRHSSYIKLYEYKGPKDINFKIRLSENGRFCSVLSRRKDSKHSFAYLLETVTHAKSPFLHVDTTETNGILTQTYYSTREEISIMLSYSNEKKTVYASTALTKASKKPVKK